MKVRFFASGPSTPVPPGGSAPAAAPSPRDVTAAAAAEAASESPGTRERARAGNERRLLEVLGPLNVLVGFSSMLADVGNDLGPEVRHRYATRVRDAAETLQRMMSALVHALEGKPLELAEDWASGTFRVATPATDVRDEADSPVPDEPPLAAGATRPRVFVVDADDANRELVAEFLAGRGYEVVQLSSGEQAIALAERRPPDLVLLDPLMPREDGFHVARMLKASHGGAFLPLVCVTALVDDDSRIRALDAGADHVMAKPVNRHELRAKVRSMLDLRARQEELAAQNAQLKSLQRFKEETTAMLVHDLKSPLSAMMMNLDFALDDISSLPETTDVRTALAESRAAGSKLFRMIANLLDIARSDDGRLVPKRASVEVSTLFGRVVTEHAAEAQARKVTIHTEVSLDGAITADPDILGRVMANLVENALRYTYAGGTIVLGARRPEGGTAVELTVTNDGRPIAPEWRPHVFEKYVQAGSSPTTNRGLGLYFCRVAAEAHGGSIELLAEGPPASPSATCFRILLPQR